MAKKKEQIAKKTAKLDDKQLDKVQGGYFNLTTDGYVSAQSVLSRKKKLSAQTVQAIINND